MDKNFNLANISEEQAMVICTLLKKSFHSITMNGKAAVITFSVEVKEGITSTEYIQIIPSGQVNRYCGWSDSEGGKEELYEVNGLPVIDYLRKQGFEFTY